MESQGRMAGLPYVAWRLADSGPEGLSSPHARCLIYSPPTWHKVIWLPGSAMTPQILSLPSPLSVTWGYFLSSPDQVAYVRNTYSQGPSPRHLLQHSRGLYPGTLWEKVWISGPLYQKRISAVFSYSTGEGLPIPDYSKCLQTH